MVLFQLESWTSSLPYPETCQEPGSSGALLDHEQRDERFLVFFLIYVFFLFNRLFLRTGLYYRKIENIVEFQFPSHYFPLSLMSYMNRTQIMNQ